MKERRWTGEGGFRLVVIFRGRCKEILVLWWSEKLHLASMTQSQKQDRGEGAEVKGCLVTFRGRRKEGPHCYRLFDPQLCP